jgi:hypothetical protein
MNNIDQSDLDDIEALENFILKNADLQKLEAELSKFNIFEAIGMVHQEIRHSHFLAFLLNPSETHGLEDVFLKRLLMEVLSGANSAPLNLIEIDVADLSNTFVQTEWHSIDILIVNESSRLTITVENKIDSREHSNQLARYRDTILRNYPEYRHMFMFLTPDEMPPSDENYIPISYGLVANTLDEVLAMRESMIGTDVASLIKHYTMMLRRHIVGESEIAELCQKIYRRHQRALDLIFEHRPDVRAEIRDYLTALITADGRFIFDKCSKSDIRFLPAAWDNHQVLMMGEGWTPSGRILLFQFYNYTDRLELNLWIGPGQETVREALYRFASENRHFHLDSRKPKKWNSIYTKRIASSQQLNGSTFDDLKQQIDNFWHHFTTTDLPTIMQAIEQDIDWIGLERKLGLTGTSNL